MTKNLFYLLFIYSFCTLSAQEIGDTIFIKVDPITVKKQVYYAKPLDKSFYHNAFNFQLFASPSQASNFTHSDYNHISVENKKNIHTLVEASYQRRTKKAQFGIGIGYLSPQSQIKQESFFFSKIDSSQSWKIDTLDEYYIETKNKIDTIYVSDSTREWNYTENGSSVTNLSSINSKFLYFPISFGLRFEKNKFTFGLGTVIQTFISLNKRPNLLMTNKNKELNHVEKDFLKTTYFKLALELSISYSLIENWNINLNYRPSYYLSSFYRWKSLNQNTLNQTYGIGLTHLF